MTQPVPTAPISFAATRRISRPEQVCVRLSTEEFAQLVSFAERLGITTVELVRRSIPAYAKEVFRKRRSRRRKGTV